MRELQILFFRMIKDNSPAEKELINVNNLEGYPGLIEFYQNLAELELNIFSKLNLNKILINSLHSNWDENYQKINFFLKKR